MFQMNCIAKQLIPPNKNAYFRQRFFSSNADGNICNFDSLCLYRSIQPLDHEDQIQFASGFTMTTFAQYALVAFAIIGNEAENNSVSTLSKDKLFSL